MRLITPKGLMYGLFVLYLGFPSLEATASVMHVSPEYMTQDQMFPVSSVLV
jgi:hypothetical protein